MKKKLLAKVAKLAMLTFAAAIVVTGSDTMTAHASDWGYVGGGGDADWDNYNDVDDPNNKDIPFDELDDYLKQKEEEAKALEALLSEKYADVNTLNATVKIKANILKAKKKSGSYVKQTPKPSKVVVNGKALKYNKKTKEYVFGYSLWDEDSQKWTDVDSLTAPGLYRLGIGGRGSYRGVYTKRIYVYDTAEGSKSISSVKVKVNKVPYSGEPITSGVITSVKLGKRTLEEGKDYTVKYLNNVNSGTGIVRLTAVEGSGLVGEKEVNFKITGGTKISKAKVTGLTAKTYNYGKAVTQDMSNVKLTINGKELNPETDYAVQYYMNNTKVGTAKIVIAGKGSYYGTITKSFKITKIPLTTEMVNEKDIEVKYTGKAVKPEVTLKIVTTDAKNGSIDLKKGTDYTLSYKNNVKAGNAAQIIVKGKGNYSGKITVTFSIVNDTATTGNKAKSADKADEETAEEVTDEEVTDSTDEPTDTEESENDETPDAEENPAEDETPDDEGTENVADDEDGTAPGETDNTGSDGTDNTTGDETGNTGSEDAGDTTSDDTDNTGSEDANDTVSDETGSTGSEDANDTVSDETGNAGSENADNTLSDDAVTDAETQPDVETVIPETMISEDAVTNAA
ncbi:MAG: hypothetical protein K2K46_05825 [Lachnospiraceae bacterium]|nr:hypothetical protein [Lachnospiraceae bacterium]